MADGGIAVKAFGREAGLSPGLAGFRDFPLFGFLVDCPPNSLSLPYPLADMANLSGMHAKACLLGEGRGEGGF
jgi:hypothetical protein